MMGGSAARGLIQSIKLPADGTPAVYTTSAEVMQHLLELYSDPHEYEKARAAPRDLEMKINRVVYPNSS